MEFLEVPLFDDDIYKLAVRFAINVFFLVLIVFFAIYPSQRQREFAFTAVMMNVTVFFICFTLKKLDLGLGMALGLFAIFGVLRYRTDAIRAKEMTYLFIVIGIAVINALSNKKTSYVELLLVNSIIVVAALLKEWMVTRNGEGKNGEGKNGEGKNGEGKIGDGTPADGKNAKDLTKPKLRKSTVDYDKMELLAPERKEQLLADLRQRTGIDVARVQVQNIDLRSHTAVLTVWYDDGTGTEFGARNP